jgi:Xaa-Pro aminopeptidase
MSPTARSSRLLAAVLLTCSLAPALAQEPPPVPAEEYAARRARVMEAIGPEAVLVLTSPPPAHRNGDVDWPFRQDDDLLYLTGVAEPDTALVLIPGEDRFREVLFARDRDPLTEVWTGPIPEHEELGTASGIAEVHPAGGALGLLEAALSGRSWGESDLYRYYRPPASPELAAAVREGRATVWLDLGGGFRGELPSPAEHLADRIRRSWPQVGVRDASHLLAGLREVKSPAEVALIQRAVDVTIEAVRAGMRRALTAERENQIQATVEFSFRDLGACCWGFPSIVAAGENTTVLHYEAGEAPVPRDGLVLLDVGAEVAGYTADVSRTFPADGTFSPEQRAIYQAVLDTSQALLPRIRPGVPFRDLHLQALELLGAELLELGLVTENDPRQVEMYFLHGLGHPLGLQVHDAFDRTRVLEAGMVWTLEPGLYVRPADVEASEAFAALGEAEQARVREAMARYAGIGVRIEDDVLVTEGAPRVLSAGAPRTVEEIEGFMGAQGVE